MASIFGDPGAFTDLDSWLDTADALRSEAPVVRIEDEGFEPMWAVLTHAGVSEVERHPERFMCDIDPLIGSIEKLEAERIVAVRTLIQMNAPEHAKYRAVAAPYFRPKTLAALDEHLVDLAGLLVRRLEEAGGECDFAADVAPEYALKVFMSIMGLPDEDFPTLLRFTHEVFGQEDPELSGGLADKSAGFMELFQYFFAVALQKRAQPTEDLASCIANGEIDGCPMPELEMVSYYGSLAVAGHDTTTASIVGGLHALIERPETLRRLQADPDLIPQAVEEILRWVTPVRHFMRTVTENTELEGVALAKGDRVYNSYLAADYDPAVFTDPRRFDIDRPNADRHLAFGFGVHYCLGAKLARMEIERAFRALLPRLETVELAGPAEMTHTTFVGGIKHLPIRYRLKEKGNRA
jgi:cytochrome P450